MSVHWSPAAKANLLQCDYPTCTEFRLPEDPITPRGQRRPKKSSGTLRKAKIRLEARIQAYDKACKAVKGGGSYTRPGSLKCY